MSFKTTLRPGRLVSIKTSISGNTSYKKLDLDIAREDDGVLRTKWETEKTVIDPAEQEAAAFIRNKMRNLMASVCSRTAFGLLCPERDVDLLNSAIDKAKSLCEEFNKTAKVTRVYFYAITGRIEDNDVAAINAINSEVRGLLEDMAKGIQNLDVKAVREAAKQAREVGQMLAPDAQARITVAIDAARATATRMAKAGEQAAQEIDVVAIRRIEEARTAFLDLDADGKPVEAPSIEGRAVDLSPVDTAAANPVQFGDLDYVGQES